ncbi:pyruvoyl-dependent arginine decarboxylase [Halorarius halobius]|uniref:pyruvoyl-dependent arginine decarboxylase n=1 Tax=Halorarius halobius TaxID=2962671 RepID=UPI0020CF767C|nr:pyruvoyl-dependent arginine decarboxylase [Halorarius halobius]
MEPIRVVWGAASAATAMSSYDAALAEAGVENYNLTRVSSVIPAGATVEIAETAPDLGPAGERLTVVQGRRTVAPGAAERACAGLGWSVEESGRGIFYEASGTDAETVRATVEEGLAAGRELRDWAFTDGDVQVVSAPADPEAYTTAVVLAAYGDSDPIL